MARRTFRTSGLAVVLILAVLSSRANTNKKYAKGETIGIDNLRDVEAEELCELGSVFSAVEQQQAMAVENLRLAPPVLTVSAGETIADELQKKPRVVVQGLERSLSGSGAHRELQTAVTLELGLGNGIPETSIADDCELVILENFSAGVFADPFQLHRLQQQKAVKYARIYGDVDLERPARNSFKSIVELRQSIPAQKVISW